MIDAVIFDMDGTMVDTETAFMDICLKIQEEMGITPDPEPFLRTIGSPADVTAQVMEESMGPELFQLFYPRMEEAFHAVHAGPVPQKPGLVPLMDFLRSQGIRMGVATSSSEEIARPTLEHAGVLHQLEVVIYGDMIPPGRGKPHPDIFLAALERLGVPPHRAVGIEDSHNGIHSLHRAGMTAIMVPDAMEVTDEMRELADVILEDLHQVIPYLQKRLQGALRPAGQ